MPNKEYLYTYLHSYLVIVYGCRAKRQKHSRNLAVCTDLNPKIDRTGVEYATFSHPFNT